MTPKTCSRCHNYNKPKTFCEKYHWIFSIEVSKQQALCDDKPNAELPKILVDG